MVLTPLFESGMIIQANPAWEVHLHAAEINHLINGITLLETKSQPLNSVYTDKNVYAHNSKTYILESLFSCEGIFLFTSHPWSGWTPGTRPLGP